MSTSIRPVGPDYMARAPVDVHNLWWVLKDTRLHLLTWFALNRLQQIDHDPELMLARAVALNSLERYGEAAEAYASAQALDPRTGESRRCPA